MIRAHSGGESDRYTLMTDFNIETGFVIRCNWWIMLFLSEHEKTGWAGIAQDICTKKTSPADFSAEIRSNLIPAFYFYTDHCSPPGHGAGRS